MVLSIYMAKLFAKFMTQKDDADDDDQPVVTTNAQENEGEEEHWASESAEEGQLSVDVYQTDDRIVIKSTIAGVRPEDIDISITNDMVTIRGERYLDEEVADNAYFYQECYWGGFSRSIILPVEVKSDESEASLKNGVLTIAIPKAKRSKSVSIKVKSD